MARDYNKKRAAPPAKKKNPSGWVWMLAGLVVGLFVAFLVFLNEHGKPEVTAVASAPEEKKPAKPSPTAANPTAGKPAGDTEKEPLKYEFYNILPKFEVKVPKEQSPSGGTAAPKPAETTGGYMLQVGSFRSAKDAETRKAELALLGIVSSVQAVTVDGNTTYHRVRIGPLRDAARLNTVRQTLRENNIEFMTLQERS